MVRIAPEGVPPAQPLLALGASVLWALPVPALGWWGADDWTLLHAVLLGVFGNAAAGATLQFGSAALGLPRLFSTAGWGGVLAVFNASLLLMLLGPAAGAPEWRAIGAPGVAVAWWVVATPLVIGLGRSPGPAAVRVPLMLGFVGLAVAASLGAIRVLGGETPGGVALHRTMGLVLGLGGVVLGASRLLLPTLTGVEWRQLLRLAWPFRRRPLLGVAWLLGAAMSMAALLVFLRPDRGLDATLPALLLAGAVALVVPPTALTVAAFLHWWRLRQQVPRGRQVPGIDRLLPAPLLGAWLALRLLALAAWILAMGPAAAPDARTLALLAESVAAIGLLAAFLCPAWRARRFRLAAHAFEPS